MNANQERQETVVQSSAPAAAGAAADDDASSAASAALQLEQSPRVEIAAYKSVPTFFIYSCPSAASLPPSLSSSCAPWFTSAGVDIDLHLSRPNFCNAEQH
jgi:hypothetical protein